MLDDSYEDGIATVATRGTNSSDSTKKLPKQRRCVSHLLNLTAGDFEKKLEGPLRARYIAAFNKLQAIWVFPRRSSQAKAIAKRILGRQLLIPCETRWNSLFDATHCVFNLTMPKVNEFINTLHDSVKGARHIQLLSSDDFKVYSSYLKVMGHVAKSLDMLQGDRCIGQGYIMPTLVTMKARISALKGGNTLNGFRDLMLGIIEQRFGHHMTVGESNRDLLIAALSHPEFKESFLKEHERIIAEKIFTQECINTNTIDQIDDENEEDCEDHSSDFFISYTLRHSSRRQSLEKSKEDEVLRYLCDTRKALAMLNEYTTIRRIFIKYNTTLPASAAVERVFSRSKLIFTHLRNRILGSNFEHALMLKINADLLSPAI